MSLQGENTKSMLSATGSRAPPLTTTDTSPDSLSATVTEGLPTICLKQLARGREWSFLLIVMLRCCHHIGMSFQCQNVLESPLPWLSYTHPLFQSWPKYQGDWIPSDVAMSQPHIVWREKLSLRIWRWRDFIGFKRYFWFLSLIIGQS